MKIAIRKLKFDSQLLEIRPLDAHVVSRYRQYMRSGAEFPDIVVDAKTYMIVAGNHRVQAALEEYGPKHEMEVSLVTFASRAKLLLAVVASNVTHGEPMSGITRTRMRDAMLAAGLTYADIAESMQSTAWCVQSWGTMKVVGLLPRKAVAVDLPIKDCGISPAVKVMTAAQYAEHNEDVGVPPERLARQLLRWLRNGWIDLSSASVRAPLHALRVEMNRRNV